MLRLLIQETAALMQNQNMKIIFVRRRRTELKILEKSADSFYGHLLMYVTVLVFFLTVLLHKQVQ